VTVRKLRQPDDALRVQGEEQELASAMLKQRAAGRTASLATRSTFLADQKMFRTA
jgi:hypothetical protein